MPVEGPIAHIVGARPNFMKAGPVVLACRRRGLEQVLVHTGQHYDEALSVVFFDQLGLPEPDIDLGVGSGTHAKQTAALLIGLEDALIEAEPSMVVVYGDVNSTLAAALVAKKLQIPLAHVEAGLRSFDWTMPEEVNRRVTDALADLLFVTSPEALVYLGDEGLPADGMHLVGNPMIDTLLTHLDSFDPNRFRQEHGVDGDYGVVTIHRPSNVDDPATAKTVVEALIEAAEALPLLIPLHPRGRETLEGAGLGSSEHIDVIDPLGYIEFLSAVRGARVVITDSGGVQEETTILDVPCLTLRSNTERPITLTHGTNRLVIAAEVPAAVRSVLSGDDSPPTERPPLWDGRAGERIAAILEESVNP